MTVDPTVPWAATVALCLALALATTAVHDETLRLLNRVLLPRTARPRRWHVGAAVLVLLVAHVLEVIVYAIDLYGASLAWPAVSTFSVAPSIDFITYVYFSFSCCTSLGIGDLQPLGHLRLVTGSEALVGLLMIGWTASFVLLEMRNPWSLERRR